METQKQLWVSFLILVGFLQVNGGSNMQRCDYNVNGSIFEYGANALNKSLYIPLHQYAGKYILIVNVATF
ncbi:hypothetical protein P4O66_015323 [Electrophorus voltai]|uniref:Uncharacterized protein n=2 Tax=Electrophorus TaxID=8004 RepID=A0AAD8Z0W7_9TELE|nr:hypothetical protein P4O66_015323 [Electrophorus voltai]